MSIEKYIVKARPGVLGGRYEEKRPLRERIELPGKRHVFINRDSHPDADIYVAIHEAKDLPATVPDYQVPHSHNTDEFYYFIGNNPDLSGLEGQIIFEGKVHKIISPACVYIPTGAVHEYKVTRGAGTLGLDPNRCSHPQVIIITDYITLYPQEYYENGLQIITASTIRNHTAALSPRIKSLNDYDYAERSRFTKVNIKPARRLPVQKDWPTSAIVAVQTGILVAIIKLAVIVVFVAVLVMIAYAIYRDHKKHKAEV